MKIPGQFSVTINMHSHGLDHNPVHTVSAPIKLVVQVVSSITDSQMLRVNTAPVMTSMANDLIAVGGYLTNAGSRAY